ncbi:hypothetical protein HH303_08100 [Rhodospirillaceae bacterium KN72]|uniref:Uncharacterized protein n=1 Tax=Pacificispira spongiicola TaxID=2729598 RepID=A0A7Y0HFC5_9PROT|nr:hypothetical protein [Pacificispira spongiicola]NMM44438.1 hypothetical protein [Pacificispira spongiicola]
MRIEFGRVYVARHYSEEEADEQFRPIVQRLLAPGFEFRDFMRKTLRPTDMFANPDWRYLAFGSSFWDGELGAQPDERPEECLQIFKGDESWFDFAPICYALAEREITEVIHYDLMGYQHRGTACATATSAHFADFWVGFSGDADTLSFGEGLLFSRDGSWAIYGEHESPTLLGGEPDFIARVAELAGGETFLKRILDDYWFDDLRNLAVDQKCSVRFEYGQYMRNTYSFCGWEPFDYPEEWIEKEIVPLQTS